MNLQFLKTIKTVYTPFKTEILKLSFLEILVALMAFITPYITKLIIDSYTIGPVYEWNYILILIGIAIGLEVIRNVIRASKNWYNNTVLCRFEKSLADNGLKAYLALPHKSYADSNSGVSYNKIRNGLDAGINLYWILSNSLSKNITQLVIALIILFVINIPLGVMSLLLLGMMLLTLPRFEDYTKPLLEAFNKSDELYYNNIMESMINVRTVQTMALEEAQYDSSQNQFKDYLKHYSNYWVKLMPKIYLIVDLSFDVLKYLTFVYGIYLVHSGTITIGDLVLLTTVVGFIMGAVHSMGSDFPRILEQSRKVDRYLHIVQADKARIHGKELPRDLQAITFDAVTFNYEDKPSVLKDVSFTINPGERVALVGPSGAGKSTIIKLLYGHYEPKQGNIRIGDLDISEVKLQSLRTYLSLVPQDVELFDNTIKNNIGIGLGEINEKDLVQASSQAAFHDFVQTLDEGYETMIGERGLKLSGGQRQRLAIARALIRKPKLLVLDEATSSLDSESEFYIQEALKNIDHSQTMLIIAHRLSTIKHCDKIIVLDQGKVVEQGSHDELLANEGLYAKLVALQDKGRL